MNSEKSSPAPDTRLAILARPGMVLLLFFVLTLGMTWPLAIEFTTALPAGSGDVRQNYWNFWWWKQCLLDLHQHPYWTQYLFFPTGVNLIYYTHSVFNMLLALPVTVLLGPGAAYNFCVLFALTLSGWGAYRLVRELTGDSRAGILGGLIYTYFPHHFEQVLEHLNLFSIQFIPFAVLYFYRVCHQGGRKNALLLGLFFALNNLCDWHLGLKLILTLLPLGIWQLFKSPRPRGALLGDLGISALLAALIVLPAFWPLYVEAQTAETPYYVKPDTDQGIDPAYLLIPPFANPIFGRLTVQPYLERAYSSAGFMCYLGFVPLALAVFGVVKRVRESAYWAGFGIATLILALGSHPFWYGHLYEDITLPFAWLQKLPVLDMLNVANRFVILTSVALAILAGMGWTRLRKQSDAMFLAIAGLILLEYLWFPFPMRAIGLSPIYAQMKPTQRQGAILDIPFHQRGRTAMDMVAQTVHERPIGGGYHSTFPPEPEEFIRQDPVLSQLVGVPKLEGPIDRHHLIQLGFDTVVIHKDRMDSYSRKLLAAADPSDLMEIKAARNAGGIPDEAMNRVRKELTAICGAPEFEDEQIAIFDLTRRP